jgi:hypothetical protein
MKQPRVLLNRQDSIQKELQLGRFPLLYRIMTVFLHPRG